MNSVYEMVLRNCIPTTILIVIVVILRLFLKRTPKWIIVLLWGIVGLRMVMPFSIPLRLSPMPSDVKIAYVMQELAAIPENAAPYYAEEPADASLNASKEQSETHLISESHSADETAAVFPLIWSAGVIALLGYAAAAMICLHKRTAEAILVSDYWICDQIETPFILGLIHPKILLPVSVPEEDIPYILAHERAHLSRKDHWTKGIGFLLAALYWFNPAVWIAYYLFNKDIELACDEKVIADRTLKERKAYSGALLACAAHQKTVFVYPLAFAEISVKERIQKVLRYRKPAVWISMASILICVITAGCFLTGKPEEKNSQDSRQITGEYTDFHQVEIGYYDPSINDYVKTDIPGYFWVMKEGNTLTCYSLADMPRMNSHSETIGDVSDIYYSADWDRGSLIEGYPHPVFRMDPSSVHSIWLYYGKEDMDILFAAGREKEIRDNAILLYEDGNSDSTTIPGIVNHSDASFTYDKTKFPLEIRTFRTDLNKELLSDIGQGERNHVKVLYNWGAPDYLILDDSIDEVNGVRNDLEYDSSVVSAYLKRKYEIAYELYSAFANMIPAEAASDIQTSGSKPSLKAVNEETGYSITLFEDGTVQIIKNGETFWFRADQKSLKTFSDTITSELNALHHSMEGSASEFSYPLASYEETCEYGCYANHFAQDFSDPENDRADVLAAADGTVAESGSNEIDGNYVIVAHDHQQYSLYASLSSISVKTGDSVKKGQKLGEIGKSESSDKAHVHFAIRQIQNKDNLLDHFHQNYEEDKTILLGEGTHSGQYRPTFHVIVG